MATMLLDAERLNTDCACVSLDSRALFRELDAITGEPHFGGSLAQSHPTLLSNLPVYLRPDHLTEMAAIIRTIEDVARTPADGRERPEGRGSRNGSWPCF